MLLVGLIAIVLVVALTVRPKATTTPPVTSSSTDVLPYAPVDPTQATVRRLAADLGPVTRIVFDRDGNLMLVGLLMGDVLAFTRDGDTWHRQAEPVLPIMTAFPGFPPPRHREADGRSRCYGGAARAAITNKLFAMTPSPTQRSVPARP